MGSPRTVLFSALLAWCELVSDTPALAALTLPTPAAGNRPASSKVTASEAKKKKKKKKKTKTKPKRVVNLVSRDQIVDYKDGRERGGIVRYIDAHGQAVTPTIDRIQCKPLPSAHVDCRM